MDNDNTDNNKKHETSDGHGLLDPEKNTEEPINPVEQNIETIVNLHMRAERNVNSHQRAIEAITAILSRPLFLYIILLFVVLWILISLLLIHLGLGGFDKPPFGWLQTIVSLIALLVTTVVLITQKRQGWLAEQRMHLDLQVSLLIEQKVTKLIDLVEQLRRDTPSVENRHDPEVEALKEPVDPHKVITDLNQMLDDANKDGK